jgi:hypothetical protein
VSTYCYPPAGELCELVFVDIAAADSAGNTKGYGRGVEEQQSTQIIQCPVAVSDALLSVKLCLSILFMNNCVMSPLNNAVTTRGAHVKAPWTILSSVTLHSILSETSAVAMCGNGASSGQWLDGMFDDAKTAPETDASFLSSLSGKLNSLLSLCVHVQLGATTRKPDGTAGGDTSQGTPAGAAPFAGKIPPPAEKKAIDEFIATVARLRVGNANARADVEQKFRGKKFFGFLDSQHESHLYYIYHMDATEKR